MEKKYVADNQNITQTDTSSLHFPSSPVYDPATRSWKWLLHGKFSRRAATLSIADFEKIVAGFWRCSQT